MEEFIDVDFDPLFKYMKKLESIKSKKINERVKQIEFLDISDNLKKKLITIAKDEFNNIEFSDTYYSNLISGLSTKNLIQKTTTKFDDSIILICFYNDFESFAEKWINHYINIGIKNFVLVDNNSKDNSTKILKKYEKIVNISFWEIKEKYNCYKMCGWKQQILEFYGTGNKFLIVDSDELFIYQDYETIKLEEFINRKNISYIKALMLDVYTNKKIYEGNLEDFNYVDRGTYRITTSVPYKQRFYGGPRSRVFGINPSLQKIPFILYTGNEVYANDHYYYPWDINEKAIFCSYLLHYKFLPSDENKYNKFVKDGRHWNNSHEYKVYQSILSNFNNASFYDKNISIPITDIEFNFKY